MIWISILIIFKSGEPKRIVEITLHVFHNHKLSSAERYTNCHERHTRHKLPCSERHTNCQALKDTYLYYQIYKIYG